ncbi:hypothetical protein LCGC14_0831570 [marine sediment metagenome]|uniref:Uncharacterized protein n=1 Tax=marine sediment metagenome TaxID=412755 RepID=A0A0F9SN07_9ZZZZ|nr:hypothetical protein [bacterium]
MKEIQIMKADQIGDTEVKPVKIVINASLVALTDQIGETIEEAYNHDADLLSRALFYSLPQGTFDRLLIKLMKRKTSSYRGITRS